MLDLSPEEWSAVRLSLKVAFWAMTASLPFGIAVALLLARGRFPGKVDPERDRASAAGHAAGRHRLHPAAALRPARADRRTGSTQTFGIVFAFRWTGAALACAVMGFPLMVRAIRLSIEAVDRKLEDAAGTLGANRAWVFLTITLPLIVPGLIAGAILSFAKSMGEFGATITFVSNIPGETQTLPTAIYTFTQVPGGDAGAIRLMTISIVISMAALLLSELLSRQAASLFGRR